MTAVSTPDAAILRYQYRRVTDLKLNIVPLREIGSADIAAGTFTYPRAEYDVDNTSTWSASKRDYFFRIYRGSTIVYEGAMRRNPLDNGDGTGTLYMAGHVAGDTGTSNLEAFVIAENDTVKQYDVVVPKSFLSRIASGVLYKRWDVAYTDQNENPRPVCNFGIDRQHTIADGGTQTGIIFDATDSYSWNGNSLTYLWTLPAGVTITTGTTTTSSITVSATHGIHNIECRVTDSVTGESKRGHRWLFVNDVSNTPAFSDTYPIDGLSIRHDYNGLEVSFTAYGDVDDTYLYTGAHVLITWTYEFSQDGETWTQPSEEALYRKTCKSFVRDFAVSEDADGITRYDFRCVDAVTMADDLPIANQVMIRNNSPTNWTQVHTRLMNSAGLAYQITEFHCSSVFLVADFDAGDLDTVTRDNYKVNQGSVGEGLRRAARYTPGALFLPALDGRYLMRRSYSYETLATRAGYSTRFTWNDTDIVEEIGYNLNEIMRAGDTEGGAFVDASPTEAYLFRRGLGAQMQGVTSERMEDFVATSENNGQWYVGQHHAFINRNVDNISFTPMHDVFDIAERYKHALGISAYDPMTRQVLASDGMMQSITYRFPSESVVEMTAQFLPETIGQDATTITLNPVNTTIYNPYQQTYTWDFTANNGGWTAPIGSYVGSTGWQSTAGGTYSSLIVQIDMGTGIETELSKITIYFSVSPSSSTLTNAGGGGNVVSAANSVEDVLSISDANFTDQGDLTSTPFTSTSVFVDRNNNEVTPANYLASFLQIRIEALNSVTITLTRCEIQYIGTNNFTGGA